MKKNYFAKIVEGKYYHVYNKAVNQNLLFINDEDYRIFMYKCFSKLEDFFDFYAYCLMPNHFHLLIRAKKIDFEKYKIKQPENLYVFYSQKLSNFYNSYSKTHNIKYERKGALFQRPYKSIEVKDEFYLNKLVTYIHRNPIHHNISNDISDWRFSSYHDLISKTYSRLKRDEVLDWFGGKEQFVKDHIDMQNYWFEMET